MPYPVVLFDLDGTLVDSIELIVQASEHAFATVLGHTPSRDILMAGIGKPLIEQFQRYARDAAELDVLIRAYRSYQLEHHDRLTLPYDGVHELVAWLADQRRSLGVVTSKIEPLAHRALQHLGLDPYFPLVVGIESTTRHKPNPDPLWHAIERLRATPQDTVYVGDSPFDLQAARAAGGDSIAVTWGAFDEAILAAESPTAVVRSAAELKSQLM